MRYLLDADWAINALAGKRGADTVIANLSNAGIGITITTIGEIYEGAFGAAEPERHLAALRTFLSPFPVVPLTDAVITRFAQLRSQLRRGGQIISDFDLLVGAAALHYELEVLTFNTRHYSRINGLSLHQVQ